MPACYSSDCLPLPSKNEKLKHFRAFNNERSCPQSTELSFLNHVFHHLRTVRTKRPHSYLPLYSSPLRNRVPYDDDSVLTDYDQTSLTLKDQYRVWLSLSKKSIYSNYFGSFLNFRLQSKRNTFRGRFIGSYEESLLNCKMPLNPSQCFPFVVDIGVVSRCKCESSLICPSHLKMRFLSIFYSSDDNDFQSPYVGQFYIPKYRTHKNSKSKAPAYGYQIPQVGQLQVMIKRLDGTLIKIFLVHYDLTDMPSESKTSLRQFIYLDLLRDNAAYSSTSLRYGVHLQICSPSDNRYYLCETQRVIFSGWSFQNSNNTVVVNKQTYPKYCSWNDIPFSMNLPRKI
ncbi:chromosome segregation protein [Schizosaccharomyces cryophilus OY26]|uniref:Chromosome segregation protein n=1 Tax=Schizosaccharomyces cryophilus (strain OY26 / ATCC MYA-4695 / CBS 11777 / NBRC 106824 / NRRL Y48691) TaxID=653667 RepID=S9W8H1_SCHCR|nr:chromosome segregation protein [Schizosaccharomyces cryophilus OY26]EPY54170.1 chromosome segregation protein [Schizosaccharomyces cryophilus OY26]